MTPDPRHSQEPVDPDLDPADPAQPGAGPGGPAWSWRLRMRPDTLGAVALGGALGTGLRAWITTAVPTAATGFPWATLWINVAGGFVLGVGLVLILERLGPGRHLRPFFATGFCGGFTTFSSLAVQADLLTHRGHADVALAYLGASLIAGVGATAAGMAIGRLAPARPGL